MASDQSFLGEDPTSERYPEITPNGGVEALWMYMDDDFNPAPKSKATRCEIHELDDKGRVIFRTHGMLQPSSNETTEGDEDEPANRE
jgi:hypothetical protein